ncbi:uncharacterized protein LOC110409755 isoform X2 [Herrania umbratica]|uniref:Uncharacterized protein LOC110409755 isoform X2 n=1 Tax=Herrania umbratica TaxID=108875 RepID=A0A6J0ZKY8_9ROSI|nr:uncharacterized protein LOC110409755 isoform X2 [Herrania umbratica]
MQELVDRPMILAVKGHLQKPRVEVACKLAKHLKYPLIDQDEITSVLQTSEHFDEISFDIVLKIASMQLTELKLAVIISTPLSQDTHFDKLKHLEKSAGAILVIIQCLPKDGSSDYDIGGVSKLTVDTTKQFDVEDFVLKELDKVKKRIYRHLHALTFSNKPNIETRLQCKRCREVISGPSYQCILGCDEYIFDKACAELQVDLEQVRKNCPDYLTRREPEYLFPRELRQNCNICEYNGREFSDSCHDCLFQTNLKDAMIATLICMSAAFCWHEPFLTTMTSIL